MQGVHALPGLLYRVLYVDEPLEGGLLHVSRRLELLLGLLRFLGVYLVKG